jgi:hypothetical protein
MSGFTAQRPDYTYGPLTTLRLRTPLLQNRTPRPSEMVPDVSKEQSVFTFTGPEVQIERSPQRHRHASLNMYITVNSESQRHTSLSKLLTQ